MQNYIILRDLTARAENALGRRTRRLSAAPPEPALEVAALDSKDVREVLSDPATKGLAPEMPIALIEPIDVAPSAKTAWGLEAVGAAPWQEGGQEVTVAVLDTGIKRDHAAFKHISSWCVRDFSGTGIEDENGHGTHCAGTIFGREVNGMRIGVAPGVKRALIGKVLDKAGNGNSSAIFQGLQWAIEQGAHVISLSLGFRFSRAVEKKVAEGWPLPLATSDALVAFGRNIRLFDAQMSMLRRSSEMFQKPGSIVVAAAGNDSNAKFRIATSLPAAAENVISVGALQQTAKPGVYSVAEFSNTLPLMSAPGVDILSADYRGTIKSLSGTSMACPHVAGVAALWWEKVRSMPVPQSASIVEHYLMGSSRFDVFTDEGKIEDRGSGLVTAPQP